MRVVLLALLMLAVTPVSAKWVAVSENEKSTYYIDPATIRKDGNLRRVWEIQDLKARASDGELSRRALREYDCKEEKVRIFSITEHSGPMATGNILTSNDTSSTWSYVAPGTANAMILRFVCAK